MGVVDGKSAWYDGENPEQRDMNGKKMLLEFKARVLELHTSGVFGLKNSDRAWEMARHVHEGTEISNSTKQEYVQKVVRHLLLPAQLDLNGNGPTLLEYALEGSNSSNFEAPLAREAQKALC